MEGIVWPDPDPRSELSGPFVDNFTRLNSTIVERTFQVRSIEDVCFVIFNAYKNKKKLSFCGTKHSMGGQTIAPNGFVIDTCKMNFIRDMNVREMTVVVGPGTTWSELIFGDKLNAFTPIVINK